MSDFRLLTFRGADGAPRPGILAGDYVTEVAGAESVLSLLARWDTEKDRLYALAAEDAGGVGGLHLAEARLMAPILYPGNVFCIASNYADHAKEMSGRAAMPDKTTATPSYFTKMPAQTVVGDGATIHLPGTSAAIDWEAELAVVIGRPCFRATVATALDYVAGYTVMNDLSIRGPTRDEATTPELLKFRQDRFRRKNFDGSAPMGPWITPKEEIADVYGLPIKLWVNDELMQDGNTADMHFTIEEQIAYLSEQLTLRPGDVILTGTPAGVGRPRGIFLKAGDTIRTTIGGLGTITVTFAEPR